MTNVRLVAAVVVGLVSVGCGKSGNANSTKAGDTAGGAVSTPPSASGSMAGAMHQDTLAAQVENHMQLLASANGDSLKALVPTDQRVVTNLIADCEMMMRQMKIDPPRKWTNAVADLRQDLAKMPSMSASQLQAFMPEHRKRIEGMLSMRRDMMKM